MISKGINSVLVPQSRIRLEAYISNLHLSTNVHAKLTVFCMHAVPLVRFPLWLRKIVYVSQKGSVDQDH